MNVSLRNEIVPTNKIIQKYKKQWVFLVDCQFSKNGSLYAGKVVFHSINKNDIYQKLNDLKNYRGKAAILYTGKFPKDIAVNHN